MVKRIDPAQAGRSKAFAQWMPAPMPMVTFFRTLDVTRVLTVSRKRGYRFHALMCWCVGKAASQDRAFYLLPTSGGFLQYDRLAISTVVVTRDGGISTCDVPWQDDLATFHQSYGELTARVQETGGMHSLEESHMVIGVSAIAGYELTGAVNLYAGCYNNPFLIWGTYRRRPFRTKLSVSFQFHHAQMDGIPAARFLEQLQQEIRNLRA